MKDRIPTYPGRVKLTPVPGQANTYDLVRADAPTEPGTPINKATLLTDETASLLNLTGVPTVNDALGRLFGIANEKCKIELGSYVGTGTVGASGANSLTFERIPKAIIMLYAKYSANGREFYQFFVPNYNNIGCYIMFPETLTTTGISGRGFRHDMSGEVNYGYKSTDGKTIYWYVTGTTGTSYQLNDAGHEYYYAAIYF